MRGLTVAICSRDGAGTLGATLEALARIAVPDTPWRVLVVDNGSTDGTADLARPFAGRLPLCVIAEPRRGKSHALNRAVAAAEGDLFVTIDDDIQPEPGWLCALWDAALADPGAAVLAGRIVGLWPRPPWPWMLAWMAGGQPLLGLSDPAWREGPCPAWYAKGGNMAVRRDLAGPALRFDEGLGTDGTARFPMGEDVALAERLAGAGWRVRYCPAATAAHVIRPHQMRKRWLLARAVRHGRGDLHLRLRRGTVNLAQPRLLGYPRPMLRRLAKLALAAARHQLARDELVRFRACWDVAYHWGVVSEARLAALEPAGGRMAAPSPATGGRGDGGAGPA